MFYVDDRQMGRCKACSAFKIQNFRVFLPNRHENFKNFKKTPSNYAKNQKKYLKKSANLSLGTNKITRSRQTEAIFGRPLPRLTPSAQYLQNCLNSATDLHMNLVNWPTLPLTAVLGPFCATTKCMYASF